MGATESRKFLPQRAQRSQRNSPGDVVPWMSGTSLLDSGFAETPACFVSTVSLFSVLAALRAFGILYRNPTLPPKLKTKASFGGRVGHPSCLLKDGKSFTGCARPPKWGVGGAASRKVQG